MGYKTNGRENPWLKTLAKLRDSNALPHGRARKERNGEVGGQNEVVMHDSAPHDSAGEFPGIGPRLAEGVRRACPRSPGIRANSCSFVSPLAAK